MTKNMGTADRVIRTALAVVVGWLYFSGTITGTLGVALLVVAVIFLLTSLVAWCPGYLPFHISTCKRAAGGTPPAGGTQ